MLPGRSHPGSGGPGEMGAHGVRFQSSSHESVPSPHLHGEQARESHRSPGTVGLPFTPSLIPLPTGHHLGLLTRPRQHSGQCSVVSLRPWKVFSLRILLLRQQERKVQEGCGAQRGAGLRPGLANPGSKASSFVTWLMIQGGRHRHFKCG